MMHGQGLIDCLSRVPQPIDEIIEVATVEQAKELAICSIWNEIPVEISTSLLSNVQRNEFRKFLRETCYDETKRLIS